MSLIERIDSSVFIVAEIGNNHNGDVAAAIELVDAAAEAGADAVKFQTFRGTDIVAPTVRSDEYAGWDAGPYELWHEFIDSIALPFEAHAEVFDHARNRGLIPFSTPVSADAVRLLEQLAVPLYKVASMDVTHTPLLREIAATGKQVILSTGMCELDEIRAAAELFADNDLVVMHCVSDYPADPEQLNLRTIPFLREQLDVRIGISDHSMTNDACVAAVALGARVIEKHFTLSRDTAARAEHHMSLEPDEFAAMVAAVRSLERGLGEPGIRRTPSERENRDKYRRSLRVNRDIAAGEVLSRDDIAIIRPGDGLPPARIDDVVGRPLRRALSAWDPITGDDL